MKRILVLLFLIGLSLLWNCQDKKPLSITAFSPALPSAKPLIFREDLKANGSFAPGYLSGKIRSNRITLDWQQSTAADFVGFRVFRDGFPIATITDPSRASYTDSLLSPDQYYDYKVAVINSSGLFQTDTIRLKTPRFQPPSDLSSQVLALDGSIIKIFWKNNAESATRYRVFRKLASEPVTAFLHIGTPTDTFFVDEGNLIQSETYEYQISALNDFEETDRSSSLLVLALYNMTAPTLTTVTQLTGSRAVRLEWIDNSASEDGFHIWRQLAGTGAFIAVGTAPTNSTSFVDRDTTNLFIDSTYIYAVTAFNSFEETLFSNSLSIQILNPSTYLAYSEGFESPTGGEWTFLSSTPQGRIERSTIDAHSGQYMLLMDVATSVISNTNEAILSINLSAFSSTDDIFLRFYYNTYNDEVSSLEDIVQVSSDGQNWTTVFSYQSSPFIWSFAEINLRDFYSQQPYSATYQIKWRQQDNLPYPSDGIGIDDISLETN